LNWIGRINFDDEVLMKPLHWREPSRIFVNSESDIFHKNVKREWIDRMFAVMALCPQHTFQVLTKEAERAFEYLSDPETPDRIGDAAYNDHDVIFTGDPACISEDFTYLEWPLPNVWLIVSTEDQPTANERIPWLLQTPAAVRGISAEPLLGPINLDRFLDPVGFQCMDPDCVHRYRAFVDEDSYKTTADNEPICIDCGQVGTWTGYELGVDWVIAGGESGPGARPMHPDWARSLRDQCEAAGVSFFFKQWGAWSAVGSHNRDALIDIANARIVCRPNQQLIESGLRDGRTLVTRVGKKAAGRLLDGRTWDEYPIPQA
jgi:protein gp37